jgi:serine/threonine protein kinase
MSLVVGSLVAGRFLIEGLAGRGGMGEVYRARDANTSDNVALKVLHGQANNSEATERFMREARLLSELKHPNIVSYLAHGQTQDAQPYLAIEWLNGQDLSQRLALGPLSFRDCTTLLGKVADALALDHQRGIIHRDLKPSNLFLRDNRIDAVSLLDFGIARSKHVTRMTRKRKKKKGSLPMTV